MFSGPRFFFLEKYGSTNQTKNCFLDKCWLLVWPILECGGVDPLKTVRTPTAKLIGEPSLPPGTTMLTSGRQPGARWVPLCRTTLLWKLTEPTITKPHCEVGGMTTYISKQSIRKSFRKIQKTIWNRGKETQGKDIWHRHPSPGPCDCVCPAVGVVPWMQRLGRGAVLAEFLGWYMCQDYVRIGISSDLGGGAARSNGGLQCRLEKGGWPPCRGQRPWEAREGAPRAWHGQQRRGSFYGGSLIAK